MATIEIDTKPLLQMVQGLQQAPARMRAAIRFILTQRLRGAEREAKRKASGPILKARTGRYRTSIASRVTGDDAELMGEFGIMKGGAAGLEAAAAIGAAFGAASSNVLVYARVQEYGKTITKKGRGVLAIPLAAALTPAGVPRFRPREAEQVYPGGTFWQPFGDHLILFGIKAFRKNWGRTPIVPLFVGVRSVTIKPKHLLGTSFKEAASLIQSDLQADRFRDLLAAGAVGSAVRQA